MVIFTFVRHGETDYNKNGILQGHLNIPLNNKGRQQAVSVGQKLSKENVPINLIITSDLDRAYETATIIKEQLVKPDHNNIENSISNNNNSSSSYQCFSPPIESTQLLRERNLGKLEGLDLRHLVHWEELPESKRAVEIQNLLKSQTPQQIQLQNQLHQLNQQQQKTLNNETTFIQSEPSSPNLSYTNTYSANSSAPSSPLSLSGASSLNTSTSSLSSTLSNSSSTSSFSSSLSSSLEIPISLTSSSTPTNVKLTSNILKHLPHKELKMESKSKLIRRAKDAFQFILRQIPSKFINEGNSSSSSTSSTSSPIDEMFLPPSYNSSISQQSTPSTLNQTSNFHILVVSHSVILRTLLSLLLCKKSPPLFCTNPSSNNGLVSQSEQSSTQNFKWIQFELKNASTIRTSFNIIEKKSRDSIKRIPREITFYPETNNKANSNSTNSNNSASSSIKKQLPVSTNNVVVIEPVDIKNQTINNNNNSNINSPNNNNDIVGITQKFQKASINTENEE
ncbi:hypothetical protein DICPUDRAFT_98874 [Dictyostelium purpureum]|uniref:Uncharacterized protein n=1 Tax=Dictyostelium purpureum TaxID=5786 RepID=F0ZUB0_DICPU|nr:uncharacterized protein DICPUDRAFT_98874 [Dictyostelium purpureum]EGC32467.1 hypothetical protein DICPUDRAFT_98874 [Dictyostelium purpureum]|eukprot:XP_003291001.1 hypothetical protein DICPUDRAFT_98874 [Dictyostelium purpureum]